MLSSIRLIYVLREVNPRSIKFLAPEKPLLDNSGLMEHQLFETKMNSEFEPITSS
jgi:hypothetical protein